MINCTLYIVNLKEEVNTCRQRTGKKLPSSDKPVCPGSPDLL